MNKYLPILSFFMLVFSYAQTPLNIFNQVPLSQTGINVDKEWPAFIDLTPFELHPNFTANSIQKGDAISVNLEGFEQLGEVTYKRTDVNQVTSYIIKFSDQPYSQVFVSVDGNNYLVSIDLPEQNRKFTTRKDEDFNMYYLLELDVNQLDVLVCKEDLLKQTHVIPQDIPHQSNPASTPTKQQQSTPKSSNLTQGCGTPDEGDEADMSVLIVYTANGLTLAGSLSNMNLLIAQQITRANNASINSDLGINFSLAHSEQVNYSETGDSGLDLSRLQQQTDGFMDNVHTLRDTFSADFVHLFSVTNDTGGLGYVLNSTSGSPNFSFALSRVQQLTFSDTFVHEIGHNMSASHASQQTVQPGPTTWSDWPANNWTAGWRFIGNDSQYYCTLMTYGSGSSWTDGITSTEISYFSTPLFTFQGQPVGNATSGDNARSIKSVKHIIANYRNSSSQNYCDASGLNPSTLDLSISNVSLADINNASTWSDFNDFSFITACLTQGETYPITVNVANGANGAKLWIWADWNNDGDFSGVNEEIFQSGTSSTMQYTTNISVPTTSFLGDLRLRLRYEFTAQGGNGTSCGDSSFGEVEDYTLSISESLQTVTTSELDFSLYPNPTSGEQFIVQLEQNLGQTTQLKLYNTLGQELLTETLNSGQQRFEFSTNGLSKGLYFIKLKQADVTTTKKLIVN